MISKNIDIKIFFDIALKKNTHERTEIRKNQVKSIDNPNSKDKLELIIPDPKVINVYNPRIRDDAKKAANHLPKNIDVR